MQLTSPAFPAESVIPAVHTCHGANIPPSLLFSNLPPDAQSLVLVLHDPDAPRGDFTHWLVWNILPTATSVEEAISRYGALQGINDFGQPGYGGPCPPSGTHHYIFELYALDSLLDLQPTSQRAAVMAALDGHILAQARLVGTVSAP